MLRIKIGHDFSKYKEKTLIRRIQRRDAGAADRHGSETISNVCGTDPHQVELLFRELLIGVTQFFRDPDAFVALGGVDRRVPRTQGRSGRGSHLGPSLRNGRGGLFNRDPIEGGDGKAGGRFQNSDICDRHRR